MHISARRGRHFGLIVGGISTRSWTSFSGIVSDRGQAKYDRQHYIPLIERKPVALRNGAPFVDMPRSLVRDPGGDWVMA